MKYKVFSFVSLFLALCVYGIDCNAMLRGHAEKKALLNFLEPECKKAGFDIKKISSIHFDSDYGTVSGNKLVVKQRDFELIGLLRPNFAARGLSVNNYPFLQGAALESKKWEIKAALQHELAHLKSHDHIRYRLCYNITKLCSRSRNIARTATVIYSRHREWQADESIPDEPQYLQGFICYLKQREQLEKWLIQQGKIENIHSGWDYYVKATHPVRKSRIERLQQRLADYYKDTFSFTMFKNYLMSKLLSGY